MNSLPLVFVEAYAVLVFALGAALGLAGLIGVGRWGLQELAWRRADRRRRGGGPGQ